MLATGHSRHRPSGKQAGIFDRLTKILSALAAVASGRHHKGTKERHRRHGVSSSRGHSHARRRAWRVEQETSLFRLSSVAFVLLGLIWIGWSILAQTVAQSLARSHPDVALSYVVDQPTALNRLAEEELSKSNGNLDAARDWAQR